MSVESQGVSIRYVGADAHRRAFLRAAAVATGGALVTASSAAAKDDPPRAAGHEDGSKPHASGDIPSKETFEGIFVAPADTLTTLERKNIALLPPAELDNLREAFRILGAPNGSIYNSWVNLHANNCQHNNNLIWPWHRAYVYYFEKRLQQALPTASPPVTIPYWAYDTIGTEPTTRENRRLPEPFRPSTVGTAPNPLNIARTAVLPGGTTVNINAGVYTLSFNGTRTSGTINGSPSYFSNFWSSLENTAHNYVHNNMGTTMSNRYFSPNDPVFWLHHSTLDRAWVRWEGVAGHANPRPGQSAAIDQWLRRPLPGFNSFPKSLVGDFMDSVGLGYTYAAETFALPLDLAREMKATVKDLDFAAAVLPERTAPAIRPVMVRFRAVQLPKSGVMEVRAFLNYPDADATTSVDDPRCVGVITLYPAHADHGPISDQVTIDLDATEAVRNQLAQEKGRTKFPLTVIVVPAPQAAAEAQAERFRYKSADVIILD